MPPHMGEVGVMLGTRASLVNIVHCTPPLRCSQSMHNCYICCLLIWSHVCSIHCCQYVWSHTRAPVVSQHPITHCLPRLGCPKWSKVGQTGAAAASSAVQLIQLAKLECDELTRSDEQSSCWHNIQSQVKCTKRLTFISNIVNTITKKICSTYPVHI